MWTETRDPPSFVTSRGMALTASALTLGLAIAARASAQVPDAGPETVSAGQFDYGARLCAYRFDK